jgi:hypothetical protein
VTAPNERLLKSVDDDLAEVFGRLEWPFGLFNEMMAYQRRARRFASGKNAVRGSAVRGVESRWRGLDPNGSIVD